MKHQSLRSLLMALLAFMPMTIFAQSEVDEVEEYTDSAVADTVAADDEPFCHKCYESENRFSEELSILCAKCFKELSASNKSGDLEATFELAGYYASDSQYQKAETIYKKAAATGKPECQLKLGEFYCNDSGYLEDRELGIEWMKKAANQNYPEAQFALAELYFGQGSIRDHEPYAKAAAWYEKVVSHNSSDDITTEWYSDAPLKLGSLYYTGYGVTQDYAKAKELVEMAMARYATGSKLVMAKILIFGDASKLDFKWYEADNDDKISEEFAKSCRTANAADLNKAIELLKEESEFYCSEADLLADIYAAKGNYAEAVKLWKKGAEVATDNACYHLGYCYYEGKGVTKNIKKAIEIWQKGFDENYYSKCSNPLGQCYMKGEGVEQDIAKAVEYWKKNSSQTPEVALELAKRYETGNGVEEDIEAALEFYLEAAMNGNEEANATLMRYAKNYETGNDGLEKNIESAMYLYFQSAKNNTPGAIESGMRMAKCLENGDGTYEDKQTALMAYCEVYIKLHHEPAKDEAIRLALSYAKELEGQADDMFSLGKAVECYFVAYKIGGENSLKDKTIPLALKVAQAFENGTDGVEQDRYNASTYYEILVDLGYPQAKEALKRVRAY